jgi:hypothetical protein
MINVLTLSGKLQKSDHLSGLRDIVVSAIIQIVWRLPELVRDITEIVGQITDLVQKAASEAVTQSLQSLFENAKQEGG